MADATIPAQNLQPNEPDLADLGALWRKMVMLTLSCHHVARIESFDAAKQTASATIVYKKTIYKPDPSVSPDSPKSALLYKAVTVDYPPLTDCPVVCLGGGTANLTFPIKPGDECLALFNDRDMDGWYAGNANAANPSLRLHSFSDAILLVGVRSVANKLTGVSTTAAELRNGPHNKLSIGAEGDNVTLGNDANKLTIKKSGDDITIAAGTGGVLATFKSAGGFVVANDTGNFTLEDNADVTFDTGSFQAHFGSSPSTPGLGGKIILTNKHGPGSSLQDAMLLLFQMLTTISGTIPLTQLPFFQSFVEP